MQVEDVPIPAKSSSRTKLALMLFWLAFVLVGWQLSVDHIFAFIGVFLIVAIAFWAWNCNPWLGGLMGFFPQVLLVASLLTCLFALAAIFPILLILVIIPTLTTFLAWEELQFAAIDSISARKILIGLVGLGLGLGELIDIFVLPSIK